MKYSCEICKYSTDNGGNWYKHNHSKKHIEKFKLLSKYKIGVSKIIHNVSTMYPDDEELKSYTCDYCDFTTSHRPNLYKHRNRCSSRKLKEKDNKRDIELKDLTIQHQQQIIEMLRDSLINGGNNSSTNGNSITEALYKKMKDNPPLTELDYDDFLSKHIHKDE